MDAQTPLAKWLEYYARHRLAGRSAATLEDYRLQVRHLERSWERSSPAAPLTIGDLDDDLVARAMAEALAAGRSPATANKICRVALALWHFARRKKIKSEAPDVDRLPEYKTPPDAWTLEELERILDAAGRHPGRIGPAEAGEWWTALVLTVYNTGLRISATMALRTEDLDQHAGRLTARAQTQKQRAEQRFDLFPDTVAALRVLDLPGRVATLFGDWKHDRNGRQWPTLNRHYKQILAAAGLTASRRDIWHKLRRSFATHLRRQGVTEADVSQLLGHSSTDVTKRYLDQSQIEPTNVADRLPLPRIRSGPRQLRLFQPEPDEERKTG